MNFKKLLLFLAAPLAIAMSSCTPESPVYTLPEIKITNAEGSEVSEINVEAEGGEVTINITATRSWAINSQSDWFSCTPMSDTNLELVEKKVEVKFTIAPNEETSSRSESIKITMDKTTKTLNITQAGKGQVALGEVLYFDNFDKDGKQAQKGSNGWATYIDGDGQQYLNPTPDWQSGVTYGGTKLTVRSNSANGSGGQHSNYEGSGMNYLWFGTAPTNLSVGNILLSHLEGNALTLSFGTERYEYNASDNTFKNDEFKVYISGDGEKWSQIEYSFLDGVNLNGKWNIATAQFNLKEVPEKLHIYITTSVSSAYALDDLKLMAGGGGAEIDLSQGIAIEDAGSGSTPSQPTEPGTIGSITAAGNHKVEGATILASYARGYLLGDSTGKMLAYLGSTPELTLAVGDVVTAEGAVTSYGGLLQFGEGTTLTKTGTTTVDHGTPKAYDGAAMDAYLNDIKIEYVTYTGTLTISGYYYNIAVAGASTAIGSIAYPIDGLVDSALNGQNITVTGYTVGASSGKYVNTMAMSVVAAGGEPVVPEPEPEKPTVELPENAVVWNIGVANQNWVAETDSTLGAGFAATVDNLKVACYKHSSTTTIITARDDHFRVYKNSALVIEPLDGRKITKIVMLCGDPAVYDGETTHYTFDMSVSDGTTAVSDQTAQCITWSGNTDKFEAYAVNGQVRIKTLAVVLEGEGSTTTPDPEPEPEPDDVATITIPELYALADGVVSQDYILNVVVSGASQNSSYGTVYVMTKGSTTAGNGFTLYNSSLDGKYNVGDELKVTLPSGVAKKSVYNGVSQISEITADNIEVVSTGNAVNNITISATDLINYLGMPVTIENATIATGGTWGSASAHTSHSFTAGGVDFTAYINKRATNFHDVAFNAGTGNLSGIAVTYKGNLQIAPRDAEDVKAFATTSGDDTPVTPEPEPEPEVGVTKTYVKVTSEPADWTGEYLIVYEEGSVAFDSSLEKLDAVSNNVAVTIADGKITADSKYAFTVAAIEGGYSIKASNGSYIGASSYANSLKTDKEYANTLSIDTDGNAVIGVVLDNGTVTMRYNYAKDQLRFRYYKSGQQPVALYKAE